MRTEFPLALVSLGGLAVLAANVRSTRLVSIFEPDATLHHIVGNSKFYDVLLPVEEIYAGMFESQGLVDVQIDVIRKRSSTRELFEYVVSARKP